MRPAVGDRTGNQTIFLVDGDDVCRFDQQRGDQPRLVSGGRRLSTEYRRSADEFRNDSDRLQNNSLSAESTLDAASIVNDGTINVYADQHVGVYATLHSHGAFTNDGSVNLSADILSDNDKIAGPVSGTGDFSLSKHSTLNFGSSVSSGETVTFIGVDKLILGQPSSFDGTIDDFSTKGDTVALKGFAESATSLLYTQTGADSCSLTLTDGDEQGGPQLRRRAVYAERFLDRAVVRRRGLGNQVRLTPRSAGVTPSSRRGGARACGSCGVDPPVSGNGCFVYVTRPSSPAPFASFGSISPVPQAVGE